MGISKRFCLKISSLLPLSSPRPVLEVHKLPHPARCIAYSCDLCAELADSILSLSHPCVPVLLCTHRHDSRIEATRGPWCEPAVGSQTEHPSWPCYAHVLYAQCM